MEKPTLTTIPEKDIPDAILLSKDPNEIIYWIGKPDDAFAYGMSEGAWKWVIGGIIFSVALSSNIIGPIVSLAFAGVVLWAIFARMKNTYYAISNRRVIFTTGLAERFTHSIDLDKISEVFTFAQWYERGGFVGRVGFIGYMGGGTFVAISNHEEVCAMVKSLIVNIKTDWSYPNFKRGPINKGYPTTYQI